MKLKISERKQLKSLQREIDSLRKSVEELVRELDRPGDTERLSFLNEFGPLLESLDNGGGRIESLLYPKKLAKSQSGIKSKGDAWIKANPRAWGNCPLRD